MFLARSSISCASQSTRRVCTKGAQSCLGRVPGPRFCIYDAGLEPPDYSLATSAQCDWVVQDVIGEVHNASGDPESGHWPVHTGWCASRALCCATNVVLNV